MRFDLVPEFERVDERIAGISCLRVIPGRAVPSRRMEDAGECLACLGRCPIRRG